MAQRETIYQHEHRSERLNRLCNTNEFTDNFLRSQHVHVEVAATILAHNLVWMLIHEAAQQTQTQADRISFLGAIRTILAFSFQLLTSNLSERQRVYTAMLHHIPRQTNPHRPNRIEPRLIKRQTRKFAFLKKPRDKARLRA